MLFVELELVELELDELFFSEHCKWYIRERLFAPGGQRSSWLVRVCFDPF